MSSTEHFPDADDFQRQTDGFMQWLSQQTGVTISSKIEVQDLHHQGSGRGVVARSDIQEGEDLFHLPQRVVLMVKTSPLNEILADELKNLGPWLSLVVVMIYEYSLGERSNWNQYFQVLPTKFDTLMFWSGEELSQLQASAVIHKIGKKDAEEDIFEKIIPLVRSHPDLFPPVNGVMSYDDDAGAQALLELAHRMGSLIMAYAFDIEKGEEEESEGEDGYLTDDEEQLPKGMVPLADLLNADADRNNARLFQEDGALVMRAIKPIKTGDEIFNDYGELPRSDLLRRYGYVTDNYAQYDVVELPLTGICHAAGLDNIESQEYPHLKLLHELEILEDGYCILRPSAEDSLTDILPDELLALLKSLTLEREELQRLQSKQKPPKPILAAREARILLDSVKSKLSQYGTTVEQDKAILQQFASTSSLSTSERRRKMAVEVRLGEKEILQHVSVMLQDFLTAEEKGAGKRTTDGTGQKHQKKAKHN
ncbi:SET domain protein [Talaromyces stipitatus ATCC 10500]|uniref:Ribosomal lysine N-methyltransferase 4 n=1 Tax=Talaromyces stipitatus (strain ATCC 10500 / CBS 375.48 / QM 6759 / NRRL 1006) TaxID=441959 RepID=B8MSN5_TALSN|nr:SET domain protein [Talaromyces stipitatus ATCC 10500]EED12472.1 SET domain protein [Talaromyces stipitatus ATCC 10500]